MRYATRYPIPLKVQAGFGLVVEQVTFPLTGRSLKFRRMPIIGLGAEIVRPASLRLMLTVRREESTEATAGLFIRSRHTGQKKKFL